MEKTLDETRNLWYHVKAMENKFMTEAIKEAKKALVLGEIPVGAVVVRRGEIISRGHNMCETHMNAVLHAEIIAIGEASRIVGDWRLNECSLYVTLEPCVMCSGAIINARVGSLVFGAYDSEYGGAGGRLDLFAKHCYGGKTAVFGGIMQSECEAMLNEFFRNIRK